MSVAPTRSRSATRSSLPPQPVRCHRRSTPTPSRSHSSRTELGRPLGRPSSSTSRFRCRAFNFRRSGRPQHSEAAHREVVLFLAQRELESAFQRLVNMEMYEEARQVASQQEKLQEIVDEDFVEGSDKESGGGGRGITATLFGRRQQGSEARDEEEKGEKYDDGEVVVKVLSLRTDLQKAIDEEDYARASKVRDQILEIEREMEKQRQNAKPVVKREPKYSLGQCVVHWEDGWTGVVCGLQQERRKRKRKNVEERSSEEVEETVYTYHVLPDAKYWPKQRNTGPCVALVDEGDLNAPAPPATWRSVHGSDPETFLISHPYMYGLFLGQDGEGNYVPSKKLREKFKRERKDVYWSDGKGDSDDPSEN